MGKESLSQSHGKTAARASALKTSMLGPGTAAAFPLGNFALLCGRGWALQTNLSRSAEYWTAAAQWLLVMVSKESRTCRVKLGTGS